MSLGVTAVYKRLTDEANKDVTQLKKGKLDNITDENTLRLSYGIISQGRNVGKLKSDY